MCLFCWVKAIRLGAGTRAGAAVPQTWLRLWLWLTTFLLGHLRTWDRPKEGTGSDDGALSTTSASASASAGASNA